MSTPGRANTSVWARGTFVKAYDTRELRPAEVMLLVRYRDELHGRLLELGCGAGRLTSYLTEIGTEVHGVDVSRAMIERSRKRVPEATFHEADFTDLSSFDDASFDAVLAPCNVLDILSDDERSDLLDQLRRVVAPGGLLMMSTHNRGYVPKLRKPHVRTRDPLRFGYDLLRLPRRVRNRRRLLPLEQRGPDFEVLNDSAHEYSLLHYYISRDDQEQQFARHGFEMLECMDLEGRPVGPGEQAPDFVELHYVARRRRD
jgi:SAM-dependent methyltransferase